MQPISLAASWLVFRHVQQKPSPCTSPRVRPLHSHSSHGSLIKSAQCPYNNTSVRWALLHAQRLTGLVQAFWHCHFQVHGGGYASIAEYWIICLHPTALYASIAVALAGPVGEDDLDSITLQGIATLVGSFDCLHAVVVDHRENLHRLRNVGSTVARS